MGDEVQGIELAQFLDQLRLELAVLHSKVDDERMRFKVDSLEVELRVGVKRAKEAKGGLSLKVIELGGAGRECMDFRVRGRLP